MTTSLDEFQGALAIKDAEERLAQVKRVIDGDPHVLEQRTAAGKFPLTLAVCARRSNIVELILEFIRTDSSLSGRARDIIEAINASGSTAMQIAGHLQAVDCVIRLMRSNAKFRVDSHKTLSSDYDTDVRVTALKYVLSRGGNVNGRDENGNPLLALACALGQQALVEYMCKQGADVNARDADGNTPLWRCETVETINFLLARGANGNSINAGGNSILHQIMLDPVYRGCLFTCLLAWRHLRLDVDNANGKTPIELALEHGQLDMYEAMLHRFRSNATPISLNELQRSLTSLDESICVKRFQRVLDADPRTLLMRTSEGQNLLALAVIEGRSDVVRCILDIVRDSDVLRAQHILENTDADGATALVTATGKLKLGTQNPLRTQTYWRCVGLLIANGANVKHRCISGFSLEILRLFLDKVRENLCDYDMSNRQQHQDTRYEETFRLVLFLACWNGDKKMAQYALQYAEKFGVGSVNEHVDTLVGFVISHHANHMLHQILDLLIEHGADVNVIIPSGASILHAAVEGNQKPLFDALLKVPQLQVDSVNSDGKTARALAEELGRHDMVRDLDALIASRGPPLAPAVVPHGAPPPPPRPALAVEATSHSKKPTAAPAASRSTEPLAMGSSSATAPNKAASTSDAHRTKPKGSARNQAAAVVPQSKKPTAAPSTKSPHPKPRTEPSSTPLQATLPTDNVSPAEATSHTRGTKRKGGPDQQEEMATAEYMEMDMAAPATDHTPARKNKRPRSAVHEERHHAPSPLPPARVPSPVTRAGLDDTDMPEADVTPSQAQTEQLHEGGARDLLEANVPSSPPVHEPHPVPVIDLDAEDNVILPGALPTPVARIRSAIPPPESRFPLLDAAIKQGKRDKRRRERAEEELRAAQEAHRNEIEDLRARHAAEIEEEQAKVLMQQRLRENMHEANRQLTQRVSDVENAKKNVDAENAELKTTNSWLRTEVAKLRNRQK